MLVPTSSTCLKLLKSSDINSLKPVKKNKNNNNKIIIIIIRAIIITAIIIIKQTGLG